MSWLGFVLLMGCGARLHWKRSVRLQLVAGMPSNFILYSPKRLDIQKKSSKSQEPDPSSDIDSAS